MKKIILLCILLMVAVNSFAPVNKSIAIIESQSINPYKGSWYAVCMVESNNNPFVVNLSDPNGGSYGIAQIGLLKLTAYNKAHGTHYDLVDLFDIDLSYDIFMWHCMLYMIDEEVICRAWNGSGKMTDNYWKRIQKYL